RLRLAVGVLLAGALGAFLTHRFANEAVRHEAAEAQSRRAVVALQALTTLVAKTPEEALGRAVADWQAKTAGVAQARVLYMSGLKLAASTAPADAGEKAAPRRLVRDEKPFYDGGQRRAGGGGTTGGGRPGGRREFGAAPAETGRRLSLAGPIEAASDVVGMVEIETAELPPEPDEPPLHYLLALLAPLVVF